MSAELLTNTASIRIEKEGANVLLTIKDNAGDQVRVYLYPDLASKLAMLLLQGAYE